MKKEVVFLDIETTGLYNADAIEISIVSLKYNSGRSVLFNSKIKTKKKIEKEARLINNIYKKDLRYAPEFKKIYPKLKEILKDKIVILYNSDFIKDILNRMCEEIEEDHLIYDCFCLMFKYAVFYDDFNDYFNSYTYQKLKYAFSNEVNIKKINKEDREKIYLNNSLSDCLMSKYLFKSLVKKGVLKYEEVE